MEEEEKKNHMDLEQHECVQMMAELMQKSFPLSHLDLSELSAFASL